MEEMVRDGGGNDRDYKPSEARTPARNARSAVEVSNQQLFDFLDFGDKYSSGEFHDSFSFRDKFKNAQSSRLRRSVWLRTIAVRRGRFPTEDPAVAVDRQGMRLWQEARVVAFDAIQFRRNLLRVFRTSDRVRDKRLRAFSVRRVRNETPASSAKRQKRR